MKKAIFLFACLILSVPAMPQILWNTAYETASKNAFRTNKLMLIDFWAVWCGPCNTMDKELWSNSRMKEIPQNFVALRVNVDYDRWTVSKYSVNLIPKVVIATAGGDMIWQRDGFENAGIFFEMISALPSDVGDLNRKAAAAAENKKDLTSNYEAALEFQRSGKDIRNNGLRDAFLECSGNFLDKASRLSKDPVLTEEIALNYALNDAYSGKHQKALKQVEKIAPAPKSDSNTELKVFVMAYCYKAMSDNDNFQKMRNQLKKQEFIVQLEK